MRCGLGLKCPSGPAKLATLGEHVAVMHDGARALVHLLTHVIGDDQIGWGAAPDLAAHVCHDVLHGTAIKPIVGVDHLEVQAGSVRQTGVHRLSVAAVFLMDGLDDARMELLPAIGLFRGIVFDRPVVDDDDLDVVAALIAPACKDGFDAFIHICRGVVTRDGERDAFHAFPFLETTARMRLETPPFIWSARHFTGSRPRSRPMMGQYG